ncbi:MAG: hypothetical protein A2521_17295 [Deltaproteobacteria bacterium RIFOXYD12_FULL_57_12]|nr:MAG: hypothetical protein A2521_17295 [Deltaproteobacteria bacterium RIFOXYD12_FULL_57_12]
MPKKQTIDEILSTEIKRDIAERYFSFRKLIEEDTMDLAEKIRQYSFILQKRISFDLIRIYILLRDETLIQAFLTLVNLDQKLFYDPYLAESPTITQRVFERQMFSGFTRAGRFKNFFLACYENLYFNTKIYQKKIAELRDEQDMIVEEIKEFYANNDLSAIMGFLHRLGNEETCGCMQGGMETGLVEGLDQKLRIGPPPPIEQVMTVIPPLSEPAAIRSKLKKLAGQAYDRQRPEFLKMFAWGNAPGDRRE